MTNLDKARELLHSGTATVVLYDGSSISESCDRGVKPLLSLVESGKDYSSYSAADKVVGRAAAMLYVLVGIKQVHADVISRPAAELLEENGVEFTYNSLVEYIINRSGDGQCPMESAVMNVTDPHEGLKAIKNKLKQLSGGTE